MISKGQQRKSDVIVEIGNLKSIFYVIKQERNVLTNFS